MLSKLPLLHFDGTYPEGFWHSNWDMDPQILGLGFLLIAGYLAMIGPLNERNPGYESRTVTRKQIWCWITGVVMMVVVLGPPFHDWGDYFLLSVHMWQHLILMLGVAPLMLIGTPAWFFDSITRRPWLDAIGSFLFRPLTSFLLGNVIMVAWHLPVLYNAALRNDYLHGTQHLMFLLSGIFTWWVIIAPNPRWEKASPLVVAIIVAANSVPGMLVGALITFADPGLYSFYDSAPRLWNFSLRDDQQLAGSSMWAITPLVYLGVLTVIFLRYAAHEQKKDLPTPPRRPELTRVPPPAGSNSGS